jgi:DNA-binding CsgD family transcriptional regulator
MDRQEGAARRSVNLVAVEPQQVGALLPEKVRRDYCARANTVMTAVCDEQDGVLPTLRAGTPKAQTGRPSYDLTPHERRMLKLMVEGHSYKTAATKLGVSVNTVAFHIQNIYRKLWVHSKTEAVASALNKGLL